MKTGQLLIDEINTSKVAPGQCAIWWLGQHSFVAKFGQEIIYIDPFLSEVEGRQIPPLAKATDITNAIAILGSHDHVDHIDRDVWPGLAAASPAAKFVVPLLLRDRIASELKIPAGRIVGIDRDVTISIGGLTITGVPAAHELLEIDQATGLHPFLGFVLEGNGFCLYHAGDTCIYEGMQAILRRWQFDLALLPINGRDAARFSSGIVGNMTYQEAGDLAGTLRPGLTLPTHFEMFETNGENPQLFIDYLKARYPAVQARIPEHGTRMLIEARR